jgi:soluble lytic murein transglycosylase-like protein
MTLRPSLAFLVVLVLAAEARAAERHLRQWVDAEGVTHLTLGPSEKARARASALTIEPKATHAATKVHETGSWDEPIAEAAEKYKIPAELVRAVIVAESNFDPFAVSRVGACGLMQLMPGTAAEMYVTDVYDPAQNIHGGTRYLRILANMFQGDLVKIIAAYNAGPEAVRKAKGIPSYAETQAYVRRVVKLYRIYKGLET